MALLLISKICPEGDWTAVSISLTVEAALAPG